EGDNPVSGEEPQKGFLLSGRFHVLSAFIELPRYFEVVRVEEEPADQHTCDEDHQTAADESPQCLAEQEAPILARQFCLGAQPTQDAELAQAKIAGQREQHNDQEQGETELAEIHRCGLVGSEYRVASPESVVGRFAAAVQSFGCAARDVPPAALQTCPARAALAGDDPVMEPPLVPSRILSRSEQVTTHGESRVQQTHAYITP